MSKNVEESCVYNHPEGEEEGAEWVNTELPRVLYFIVIFSLHLNVYTFFSSHFYIYFYKINVLLKTILM